MKAVSLPNSLGGPRTIQVRDALKGASQVDVAQPGRTNTVLDESVDNADGAAEIGPAGGVADYEQSFGVMSENISREVQGRNFIVRIFKLTRCGSADPLHNGGNGRTQHFVKCRNMARGNKGVP